MTNNLMPRTVSSCALWLLLAFASLDAAAAAAPASGPGFSDSEGCLLCHKYPRIGRVTDEGARRSYYIMPEVFAKTVHRNVPCRDCHTEIRELPHKPVTRGVTCDTECHSVKNPATGKPFSHKPIYEAYRASVHGRDKQAKGTDGDKPYCVSCHTNPLYNPQELAPPAAITDRCTLCHEDRNFVNRWYNHTSRRIREVRRTPEQIVQLCSTCHDDQKMVQRHQQQAKVDGRPLGAKFPIAVNSYEESFHGKMVRYGYGAAANCLSCHADRKNYYLSVHEIRPSRDPKSPVHADRRLETCRQCHTRADVNYASLDPHPTSAKGLNAFRYYAEMIYNIIGNVVIAGLVGLSLFETYGRWRDGVCWRLLHGSSWRRNSRRGRDRVV